MMILLRRCLQWVLEIGGALVQSLGELQIPPGGLRIFYHWRWHTVFFRVGNRAANAPVCDFYLEPSAYAEWVQYQLYRTPWRSRDKWHPQTFPVPADEWCGQNVQEVKWGKTFHCGSHAVSDWTFDALPWMIQDVYVWLSGISWSKEMSGQLVCSS